MANQYFENNENLKSEIKEFDYYFKGNNIKLYADNGVFSKSGVDFGSNLLLKNVCKIEANSILDVGCGYGTIGVTLAFLNKKSNITMVDVNLRAIDLTKKALEANDINNAVVFESNMYENVKDFYDLIVTNPPIRAGKKIVHGIILGAVDHLNDNGSMVCVIQKKQGAPSAITALKDVYSDVQVIDNDKGYMIIRATK